MSPRPVVVVGVDGSPNSRRALVEAGHHANAIGGELVVVHALGLTDVIAGEHVPTFGHRTAIATEVARWCDALREIGRDEFDVRLVDGSPVDVLLRVADDTAAAAIVVGRRGSGGSGEQLLGSTAHQIIEHARCPIVVIPPIGHSAGVGDEPTAT